MVVRIVAGEVNSYLNGVGAIKLARQHSKQVTALAGQILIETGPLHIPNIEKMILDY